MKAYMSDGRARETATRPGPDAGFTERSAGYLATFEAQRILAVTEPVSCQSDYYRAVGLWPSGLPRPTMARSPLAERVLVNMAANAGTFALIGVERQALAEALRAFVVSR